MNNKLLLYSTGFDSELYRLLEEPMQLMFFTSGATYEKHEVAQLKTLQKKNIITENVIVNREFDFSSVEGKNMVVPMRNIYYIMKAFEYSNNVLLGVTLYDRHYDKQPDVHNAFTSFIQNYYYFRDLPKTWDDAHPRILTPYRMNTKGELLKQLIDEGVDISHLITLRTCYSATSKKGCGKCKSCYQKALALAYCGLFKPSYFDTDVKHYVKVNRKLLFEDLGVFAKQKMREEIKILLNA